MEIAVEHKKSKRHQTFTLSDDLSSVPVEELTIHLGLDTYTLKTTKTEKEQDTEKRIEFFQNNEYAELAAKYDKFGILPGDSNEHKELLKLIETDMISKVKQSEALKDVYKETDNKKAFIHKLMLGFAEYVAMVRGIEHYAKHAKDRRTHKCYPIDYCNRIMNVMRKILNNKFKDLDELNKEYSQIFQDANTDERPNVGLTGMLVALEEFTRYMADVMRAGRKIELYEIIEKLKEKAELTFTLINNFKKHCIEDGKHPNPIYKDKFADYIMMFHTASVSCVDQLVNLDTKHHTSNMDELELRHYVNTTIEALFTKCDDIILKYTMDKRGDLPVALDSYIVGYYSSIYSLCDKDRDEIENKYVELFRHLSNLNMQQKTLFKETGFPDKLEKFKQYVEDEYTNILHNSNKTSVTTPS